MSAPVVRAPPAPCFQAFSRSRISEIVSTSRNRDFTGSLALDLLQAGSCPPWNAMPFAGSQIEIAFGVDTASTPSQIASAHETPIISEQLPAPQRSEVVARRLRPRRSLFALSAGLAPAARHSCIGRQACQQERRKELYPVACESYWRECRPSQP